MPDDQRAIALKEHRFGQFGQHLRPGIERGRAEARDQQFGAGRFGERREHRRRHPCRGLRAGGIAALVQRDAVPRAGEPPGDQPAAQATADDGEIRLSERVHRRPAGTRRAACAPSRRGERRSNKLKNERSSYPFRTATGARTQGRNRRARPAGQKAHPVTDAARRKLEETGRKADFRKLPAPVLPGSGAKGLSQPRRGVWPARKAPLFRRESLDHKRRRGPQTGAARAPRPPIDAPTRGPLAQCNDGRMRHWCGFLRSRSASAVAAVCPRFILRLRRSRQNWATARNGRPARATGRDHAAADRNSAVAPTRIAEPSEASHSGPARR